jgi:hypothetical protein
VAEELGFVEERGIHGDREASGLRLDDEPNLPVHRLDARLQRAAVRVPSRPA